MSTLNLSIGGIDIPIYAALDIEQSYELVGGFSTMRMMSGAAVKQQHWTKLRTTIAGGGWIPAGLATLDWSAAQTIKCVATRSVTAATNLINIPSSRRTDSGYTPFAHAHMASGEVINTTCTMVVNQAVCGIVAGAVAYTVRYFPQLSAYSDGPRERTDVAGASMGWELVAEEA